MSITSVLHNKFFNYSLCLLTHVWAPHVSIFFNLCHCVEEGGCGGTTECRERLGTLVHGAFRWSVEREGEGGGAGRRQRRGSHGGGRRCSVSYSTRRTAAWNTWWAQGRARMRTAAEIGGGGGESGNLTA